MTEAMLIAGVAGWLVDRLVEHFSLEGMRWLLKQPLILMGMDLPVWAWIGLAIAVVVALIALWKWDD